MKRFILLALLSLEALAQTIIFDNASNFLGQRTMPQNAELGDVVAFAPGTPRFLTRFSFEYFMTTGTSGNETAQVFIRSVKNDLLPDAILFQTEPFTLAGGFNSVHVSEVNTWVPDRVAWTVKFSGFQNLEEAGLLFYNPPAVGNSVLFNGLQFSLVRNLDSSFSFVDTPGVIDNFAARFTAVPELPSATLAALLLLAGALLSRTRHYPRSPN